MFSSGSWKRRLHYVSYSSTCQISISVCSTSVPNLEAGEQIVMSAQVRDEVGPGSETTWVGFIVGFSAVPIS
jgi:hypothetical protein